jgi:hypothetical protein
MAESAGALLLRAGIVTPDQLMTAHAARQAGGGTLGSHLVRMGVVDEEALADFYRHRLMVPRVRRTDLERVPAPVVERVPRDMAAEFRVMPIALDREGNLTLAMADPSDTHAVDEVAFFAGHYVMRAVALESDVEWALAKYYGILPPQSRLPVTAPVEATQVPSPPGAPGASAVRPAHADATARPVAASPLTPPSDTAVPTEPILLTHRKPSRPEPAGRPPGQRPSPGSAGPRRSPGERPAERTRRSVPSRDSTLAASVERELQAEEQTAAAPRKNTLARRSTAGTIAPDEAAPRQPSVGDTERTRRRTLPGVPPAALSPPSVARPLPATRGGSVAPSSTPLGGTGSSSVARTRTRSTRTAPPAPGPAPVVPASAPPPSSSSPFPPSPAPTSEAAERPLMLALLDVVDQVRSAAGRDDVARVVLGFLENSYLRSAFFVIKKGVVATLDARGKLPRDALRALAIPLDAPSLLRDVIASRTPYQGPLWSGPLNNLLAVALGELPAEIILQPVTIRDRVVGVLYADTPQEPIPEGVLARLAMEAGNAYGRILRGSR